jgi:hypothetical protein
MRSTADMEGAVAGLRTALTADDIAIITGSSITAGEHHKTATEAQQIASVIQNNVKCGLAAITPTDDRAKPPFAKL